MSHYPVHYDYCPAENYFVEEPDVYSDSECLQENVGLMHSIPPNMMREFYVRNPTVVPVRVLPHNRSLSQMIPKRESNQYIQQPYYKSNPVAASASYYEPRKYYPITTSSQPDSHFGNKAYHNVEQYPPINYRKNASEVDYSGIQTRPLTIKKFPVTFPTPKYYRKPTANAVYKRPSALCLLGATQPDPAVIRRPRKVPIFTERVYQGMPELEDMHLESPGKREPVSDLDIPHRVDSQGDVNVKPANFDEFFEQMEKRVVSHDPENKGEMAKIARLLKPKVPSTVRARQENLKSRTSKKASKNNSSNNAINNADNKITETKQQIKKNATEETATSLEKLLNQLKKCELAMCNDESSKIQNSPDQDKKDDQMKQGTTKEEVLNGNSFNYQDVNENMRVKCDSNNMSEECRSLEHLTKQMNSMTNSTSSRAKNLSKPALDDHCALELHRSKSYIVNLIDRALSKELGTIPSKGFYNESDHMNPRRAIDLMNRHVVKTEEKHFLLNCSRTESQLSNYTNEALTETLEEDKNSPKSKLCCCNSEEPVYIKQLKKLRWGHLKHIQREVKRLEELERFLDSCSITTIPEA